MGKRLLVVWNIFGITLLLLILLSATLDAVLPDPGESKQVVPGAAEPDRQDSPAYNNAPWVATYWNEHDQAKAMRWQPYTYWRRKPFSGQTINVSDQGIRHTAKPNQTGYTVWMFGGSAVWGSGVPDSATIPSQLVRAAQDQQQPLLQIINFGESGYVSTQALFSLQQQLAREEPPDLVVFVDGVNDVFAALQAGQPGLPQNEFQRAQDFAVGRWEIMPVFLRWFPGFAKLLDTTDVTANPELAQAIGRHWLANLQQLDALSQQYGFQWLAYWQPSVFSRATPTAFEKSVIDASIAAHRQLQQAVDSWLQIQVLPKNASLLLDIFDTRVETIYLDFVHLGPLGNRLMAERIYQDIRRTKP